MERKNLAQDTGLQWAHDHLILLMFLGCVDWGYFSHTDQWIRMYVIVKMPVISLPTVNQMSAVIKVKFGTSSLTAVSPSWSFRLLGMNLQVFFCNGTSTSTRHSVGYNVVCRNYWRYWRLYIYRVTGWLISQDVLTVPHKAVERV